MFTKSTLHKLFEKSLVIPMYQRKYEWDPDDITQLWFDIKIQLDSWRMSVIDSHFFGFPVYIKTKDDNANNSYQIVDGQQRITSIFIILIAIIDQMEKYETIIESTLTITSTKKKELIGNMNEFKTEIQDSINNKITVRQKVGSQIHNVNKKVPRITYEDDDSIDKKYYEELCAVNISWLVKYVSEREEKKKMLESKPIINQQDIQDINLLQDEIAFCQGIFSGTEDFIKYKYDCIKKLEDKGKEYRNNKILKNYRIICDEIDKLLFTNDVDTSVDILTSLWQTINQSLEIIEVVEDDESSAFETFEVLNDRGKPVSNTDLIKNLFLRISRDDCTNDTSKRHAVHKVNEMWKNIYEDIIGDRYDNYFYRLHLISRYGHIGKNKLYRAQKFELGNYFKINKGNQTNLETIELYFETTLKKDAKVYSNIKLKREIQVNTGTYSINNAIHALISTKSKQWYPIAIALVNVYNSSQFATLNRPVKLDLINAGYYLLRSVHKIMCSIILNDQKTNIVELIFPETSEKIYQIFTQNQLNQGTNCSQTINELLDVTRKIQGKTPEIDFNDQNIRYVLKKDDAGYMLIYYVYFVCTEYSGFLKQYSLEHVFPQKPKVRFWGELLVELDALNQTDYDDYMSAIFNRRKGGPKVDEPIVIADNYKPYVYSIGNYLLMDPDHNSTAKNKAFVDKKLTYNQPVHYVDPLNIIYEYLNSPSKRLSYNGDASYNNFKTEVDRLKIENLNNFTADIISQRENAIFTFLSNYC